MRRSRPLSLELLEDRLTPSAWGLVWPNPGHITVSFVPDGTPISNYRSNLFGKLNGVAPSNTWEQTILQALQTWAVNTNINVGLVTDGGQPLGSPGAVQSDSRLGDIRIAMTTEPSNPDIADTAAFELSGSTWDGDMIFNNQYGFGINGGGQYDLFSVALHEAGHDFGFSDETTDPTSANYALYNGVRTGLSSGDIANIQAEYGGARSPNTAGNSSRANATALAHPDQTPVTADINSPTTAEFYSFKEPSGTNNNSFTVQVNTAGISLLEPSVTVFNASGTVIGTGAATSPLSNNVSFQINNAQPTATYYVEVTAATSSVFGIGSYQMSVTFPSSSKSSSSSSYPTTNTSFATALALSTVPQSSNTQGSIYNTGGNISAAGQSYYYQLTTPTVPSGGTETVTITANSTDSKGLNPYITVFNSSQSPVSFSVVNNGGGTYTVQQAGLTAGTSYYIEVNSLAGPTHNLGIYALSAECNNASATNFTQLDSGTETQSTPVSYQTMTVQGAGVVEFNLNANIGSSTVASAVRMTIFDQSNHQVFTMVAYANQVNGTGFMFLTAGTYTVRFNAATQSGGSLPNLNWLLTAQAISVAQSSCLIDTTLSGTGSVAIGLNNLTNSNVIALLPGILNPYSP